MVRKLWAYMVVMGVIIMLSNILVQHPLGMWLTYGALTYPFAFLVTDIVNRRFGAAAAQRVVVVGLVVGIICSLVAAGFGVTTLRIAIASAVAFLVAQSLDIRLFDAMRQATWWKTPLVSSVVGSLADTFIFFFIAFSAFTFSLAGDANAWAQESVQLLGIGRELPLWVSLASADLLVKLLFLPLLLVPYRWYTRHV